MTRSNTSTRPISLDGFPCKTIYSVRNLVNLNQSDFKCRNYFCSRERPCLFLKYIIFTIVSVNKLPLGDAGFVQIVVRKLGYWHERVQPIIISTLLCFNGLFRPIRPNRLRLIFLPSATTWIELITI